MRPSPRVVLALCLLAAPSRAESFAEPPGAPLARDPDSEGHDRLPPIRDPAPWRSETTARLRIGPALRVGDEAAGALFAGLDLGSGAAGLRLSASFARLGAESDAQQYGGELWLDVGGGGRLRPVVAAGAALARLSGPDPGGGRDAATLGVGTLRAGVDYVLPLRDADARAAVEILGALPAIRGSDDRERDPWILLMASVGVGF